MSEIMQWNNLDLDLRNSNCLNIFRSSILKFITPSADSAFNSHNPKEIEFIARVTLIQSSTCRNANSYFFQDLLNPVSNCCLDIELF